MFRSIAAFAIVFLAHGALAADQPRYEPPPAWAKPLEIPRPPVGDSGSTRFLLEDVQDKFGPDGVDTYWELAERIEAPQGLANVGNIAFDWNPDTETLLIHRLRILRGGQVIDLLADGQKFIVLRRENKLEYAMLDGTLTAAVEPEGLQVGDILDIAVGYEGRDPILRGRSDRIFNLPTVATDRFVIRELLPSGETPHWRETAGLDKPKITTTPDGTELVIDMANAVRPKPPNGAPDRYMRPGRFEISQVGDWSEVSALMAPLYDRTAVLKPDSPLRREIAKIKAASDDPKVQAAAALRLVQEQVRYLFLGMNNGGYVPAPADLTWARRFGDCKGKTVLLLALLRELGIQAEPALVNTEFGDGLDTRPAMASAFDHVMVRAEIGAKVYWLDGTRPADRTLDALEAPDFHWALPLTTAGATLEKLAVPPYDAAQRVIALKLDASAGVSIPAPAHAELLLRGEEAIRERLKYAELNKADTEKSLRDYWAKEYDFIDIKKVDLAFDEATGEERFTMDGEAKMEWQDGRGYLGRRYETDGATLGWKADFSRDPGPDQDAPFVVYYPDYTLNTETIVLPNAGKGFTIEGPDVDKLIAAREFKRTSKIDGGVFTMQASTRAVAPEFPAADAPAAKQDLLDMRNVTVFVRAPYRYRMTDQELARATAAPATAHDFFEVAYQYDLRNDNEHAIANYDRAIALRPDWALAYANRGGDHFEQGDIDKATADVDKALELDPNDAVALRARGLLLAKAGKNKEAIESFSRAQAAEPSNTFGLEHRALAYLAEHDTDKALADYRQIVRLEPSRIYVHDRIVEILMERRDADGLRAEADELAKQKIDGAAHFARGYANLYVGKKEDARAEFNAVLAMKPEPAIYVGLAWTREKTELDAALQDIDGALKLNPDFQSAYFTRAQLYMRASKPDMAIKDIDWLLQRLPGNVELVEMRSLALVKEHEYDQAVVGVDDLLNKTPDDPILLNNRCWYRALSGEKLDSALASCDASLKIKPLPATWDSRGMVDLKLGRLDEAISDYDAALKLRPKMATSLFGRGLAKLRKGSGADGQADLAAARELDPEIDSEYADYGLKP
jgi:tetratricopeptide (TPR) repeat protein